MIITTSETIANKNIVETLGLVSGSIVLSKNLFSDIGAGLKSIVGGELGAYTEMQEKARHQALERLMTQAEVLGANGVVAVKYSSSTIVQGASEIIIIGTAVRFEE